VSCSDPAATRRTAPHLAGAAAGPTRHVQQLRGQLEVLRDQVAGLLVEGVDAHRERGLVGLELRDELGQLLVLSL
jgi:hypothetical protein